MPEKDIDNLILSALLEHETKERLLEKNQRMELLGEMMLKQGMEFTSEEIEKLMEIQTLSIEAFAEACLDKNLVRPMNERFIGSPPTSSDH